MIEITTPDRPPFMRANPDAKFGFNFWVVQSTGNQDADMALGQAYARAAVAYAKSVPAGAGVIALALAEMIGRGPQLDREAWIETGFLTTIASLAFVGSAN